MNNSHKGTEKRKKSLRDALLNTNSLETRAYSVVNAEKELGVLEVMLEELRTDYERYFLGLIERRPTKLHAEVRMQIRKIQKAPFKKLETGHRLRALETRYNTYNNYWERISKQKEDGIFKKDLFKAELKQLIKVQDAEAQTVKGKAESQFKNLFEAYKKLVEQQTGQKQEISFENFKKVLASKAKSYKEDHGNTNFKFKVVVKEGKVTVQASQVETEAMRKINIVKVQKKIA